MFLLALAFAACGNDGSIEEPVTEDGDVQKVVEIPISFDGDITTVVNSSTRADFDTSNDLYSILIVEATSGVRHAYGVFDGDHIKDLTVSLYEGYSYNITATMIKDAKKKILTYESRRYVDGQDVNEEIYGMPFTVPVEDINEFVYSSNVNYAGEPSEPNLELNDVDYHSGWIVCYPVDRYYGELSYTPGSDIKIDMLRMSFQLVFDVKNLGEGEKVIISSRESTQIIPILEIDYSNPIYDDIFSFSNVKGRYDDILTENESSAWGNLVMKWYDADGNLKNLKTKMTSFSLKCERGKKQTVEINLTSFEGADESGAITFEEDEEMTSGGSYTVDKDGKH